MKKIAIGVAAAIATSLLSSSSFAEDAPTNPAGPTSTTISATTTVAAPPPKAPPSGGATSTTTVTSADTDATASAPPLAPHVTSREAPPSTPYARRRPNRPLLVTGAIVLGASYATTVAFTAANDGPDKALYLPVVGPWMHLADRDVSTSPGEALLIGASGVVQGVGVALMIASVAIPEKIPRTFAAGPVKVTVAGLGAVGAF